MEMHASLDDSKVDKLVVNACISPITITTRNSQIFLPFTFTSVYLVFV